ncbi:MAG: hypothetical protein GX913_03455 [Clostridiales bacterium]|nr:hypothetical protein [Clostridiales bacterium]
MENSLKGLMLAAGTIITCIIIGLGFFIAREAKDTAAAGAGQINELNAEFSENARTIYDGTEVSGSEVLNVIRKFQGEPMGVWVKTMKESNFYGYEFDRESGELDRKSETDYKTAQKEESDNYINPIGRFEGSIIRDANGTITGLEFEQQ